MAIGRIDRTVRFVGWENVPDRPEFDLPAFTQAVQALDAGNWRLLDSDMTTAAIVERHGDPLCLRYFRIREEGDLPSRIDAARQTLPLELPAGESITDWTHVVIWSDGYAASDPHRDAPTLSRLEWYARQRANQRVRFIQLYDRSLLDQLQQLDDLTAIQLRITRSDAAQAVADGDLGLLGGLFALYRGSESATVETKMSVGRSRSRELNENMRGDLLALAERASELLDQLVIRGRHDGRSVTLDLLKQRIQRRVNVPRIAPGVRAPHTDSMFDRIIELRAELDANNVLANAARATAA
jgi:hypothetical protein